MAQLAQTYIHLAPYDITRRRSAKLGDRIVAIAQDSASNVYRGNVSVEVRLDEGSLKAWLTVVGVIVPIYAGVAEYKDFRESVILLCDDARTFGTSVIPEVLHAAKATEQRVFRTEKRLKAPGKISRIIKKVEVLDQMAEKLRAPELRRQLDSIERDLKALEKEMSSEEMVGLRRTLIQSSPLKNLPDRHTLPEMPKAAVQTHVYQPELLGPDYTSLSDGKSLVPFEPPPHSRLIYHKTVFVPPTLALEPP